MRVYIENPLESTKKLLDLTSEFSNTVGGKVSIHKSKAFLYTSNKISESEIRGKNTILHGRKGNKVPRENPNQGGKRPVLRKLHNTEERN